jgi:hypothetical protein
MYERAIAKVHDLLSTELSSLVRQELGIGEHEDVTENEEFWSLLKDHSQKVIDSVRKDLSK